MLKVLIYVEFYEVNPQNMQSQSVRILYLERTGEGEKNKCEIIHQCRTSFWNMNCKTCLK